MSGGVSFKTEKDIGIVKEILSGNFHTSSVNEYRHQWDELSAFIELSR